MKTIHKKNLSYALTELGLDQKQADIYLACLEIGSGTIMDIAREGGIERTGIYYHIDELVRHGLIKSVNKGKRTVYLPSNPQKLQRILDQKIGTISVALPKLSDMFNDSRSKSDATYFQGEEGLIDLYEQLYDIAEEMKNVDEYLIFGHSFDAMEALPNFFPKYIARRSRLNLQTKIILPASEKPDKRVFAKMDDPLVRAKYSLHINQRKYLEKKYDYPGTTLILGNYIATIDFKTYYGTLTRNTTLAQTWRVFFQFMWDKL